MNEDSPRASLLNEAKALVCQERNNDYGPPFEDFSRTADILDAMGYRGPGGRRLAAHDTAVILASVKLSRIVVSPQKRDHWADLAGYAACGHECADEESKPHAEGWNTTQGWQVTYG